MVISTTKFSNCAMVSTRRNISNSDAGSCLVRSHCRREAGPSGGNSAREENYPTCTLCEIKKKGPLKVLFFITINESSILICAACICWVSKVHIWIWKIWSIIILHSRKDDRLFRSNFCSSISNNASRS